MVICLYSVTVLFSVVIQSLLEFTGTPVVECVVYSLPPKLRVYNLGYRLLLNHHHQHGCRRRRMFRSMNTLVAGEPTELIIHCAMRDYFQLVCSRLRHSQLDAHSAALLSLWITLLLSLPVVLTAVISCKRTGNRSPEQKPLTPTLTRNSQVRQPFTLQRSRSSVYFAFFLS